MKVGVHLVDTAEQSGGQHTLTQDLISALLKMRATLDHDVVFLGSSPSRPPLLNQNQELPPYLCVERSVRDIVTSGTACFAKALWQKARYPLSPFKKASGRERHILATLRQHHVGITWSFCPRCLSLDIPYIVTVWDLEHRLHPFFPEVSLGGEYDLREERYTQMLRRATYVLTGTRTGQRQIATLYQVPLERIKVVPYPTPAFAFEPSAASEEAVQEKYGIGKDFLLYPAQFWPHKNHVTLLLALKHLRVHFGLRPPLVLVGSDKGNRPYIQEMIDQLDLSTQVHLLGFVPRPDLLALYRKAYAMVFASFFGPDNLPPLEAFALRCPVIASDIEGAREQLEDAALFFKVSDEASLAETIRSLYEEPELRIRLIEKGLQKASGWTAADYVKSVFRLLDAFSTVRRNWPS